MTLLRSTSIILHFSNFLDIDSEETGSIEVNLDTVVLWLLRSGRQLWYSLDFGRNICFCKKHMACTAETYGEVDLSKVRSQDRRTNDNEVEAAYYKGEQGAREIESAQKEWF